MNGVLTAFRNHPGIAWGLVTGISSLFVSWYIPYGSVIVLCVFMGLIYREVKRKICMIDDPGLKLFLKLLRVIVLLVLVQLVLGLILPTLKFISTRMNIDSASLVFIFFATSSCLLPVFTWKWLFRSGWRDKDEYAVRFGLALLKQSALEMSNVDLPVFYSAEAKPIMLNPVQQSIVITWSKRILIAFSIAYVLVACVLTRAIVIDTTHTDTLSLMVVIAFAFASALLLARLAYFLHCIHNLVWARQGYTFYSHYEEQLIN